MLQIIRDFLPPGKTSPLATLKALRVEMKKIRFKILLRIFLLFQFAAIFGVFFWRDISAGYFRWDWAFLIYLACLPAGFLMGRIVPMRLDTESQAVIMTLDRVYLVLIWILVIVKLITGRIPALIFVADICMAVILGIMTGRLGGIGVRVRNYIFNT